MSEVLHAELPKEGLRFSQILCEQRRLLKDKMGKRSRSYFLKGLEC